MIDRQSSSSRLEPAAKPMDILRERTCDCHERVESGIAWQAAFASLQNYRRLLEAFASVLIPIESRIAELLDALPPDYRPTQRSEWLRSDLAYLESIDPSSINPSQVGGDHANIRVPVSSSPVDAGFLFDQPGAVGALYVLEGSSLGGQIISRQLQASLQIAPARGGRYFAGRGLETMAYWRSFGAWANERLQSLRGTEAAVQAARATFSCFGQNITGQAYE